MKDVGTGFDLNTVFATPEFLLRNIDLPNRRAEFVRVSAETYARSYATGSAVIASEDEAVSIDLAELGELVESRRPSSRRLHFIFHTGHAGSLQIARLIGKAEGLFPLHEPPAVQLLSWEWRFLGTARARLTRDEWLRLREIVLVLAGRTWRAGDTALVRTTSDCTRIMRSLLDRDAGARAILLNVGLERFLRTMLQPGRREEVARYVEDLFYYDLQRILGEERPRISTLSQGKRTALVWLIHTHEFGRLMMDSGYSARVMLVDFDRFLANRERIINDICGFLGVPKAGPALAADPELAAVSDQDEAALHPVLRAEIYDAMQWAAVMKRRMAGRDG